MTRAHLVNGKVGVEARREWLRGCLEEIYRKYNKRAYVSPDPLEFLYHFTDPKDQEIVGVVCATLAYGRVETIVKKVAQALAPLGKAPRETLLSLSSRDLESMYNGFKHRFHTGQDMARLLWNMKGLILEYDSLGESFRHFLDISKGDLLGGLGHFVDALTNGARGRFLFPDPRKGSASKRLFLYLRWMVRCDEVDPGCWKGLVSPGAILVPLDTHLYSIGRHLGFTKRKSADLRAATEITQAFKEIEPEDPVKYDFCLTRFGINPDFSKEDLFCLLERYS